MSGPNSSKFHDARSAFEKRDRTVKPENKPNQQNKAVPQNQTARFRSSIVETNGEERFNTRNGDNDSESSSTDFSISGSLPLHVVACSKPSLPAGGEFPSMPRPITSLRSAIALSSGFSKEPERDGKDKSPSKPGRSKNNFARSCSLSSPGDLESCGMSSKIMQTPDFSSLSSPSSTSLRTSSSTVIPPPFRSPLSASVGVPLRSSKLSFSPSKISPTGVMSPFTPHYRIQQLPSVVEDEPLATAVHPKENPAENLKPAQTNEDDDATIVFGRGRLRQSLSPPRTGGQEDRSLNTCPPPPPPPPFVTESPSLQTQLNVNETDRNAEKRVRFATPHSEGLQRASSFQDGKRAVRSISSDDKRRRKAKATPGASVARKDIATLAQVPAVKSSQQRSIAAPEISIQNGNGKNTLPGSGSRKSPSTPCVQKITTDEIDAPKRAPSMERQKGSQVSNDPLCIAKNRIREKRILAAIRIQALFRMALQRSKVKWYFDLKRKEDVLTRKLREINAQTTADFQTIRQEVKNSHEAADKEISCRRAEDYKRELKLENSSLKSRNEHLEERCRKFRSVNMQLETTIATRRGYETELRMHCDICAGNNDQLRQAKQELKRQEKEMDELFLIHTDGAFKEHRAKHTYHWSIQEIVRRVEATGDESLMAEILRITDDGLKALEGKPSVLPFTRDGFLDDHIEAVTQIQMPRFNPLPNKKTIQEKPLPKRTEDADDTITPLPPALILWKPNSFGFETVEGSAGSVSTSTDDSTVAFGSIGASLDETFDDFDDDFTESSQETLL